MKGPVGSWSISVCLSACRPVCLSVGLSVCLSVEECLSRFSGRTPSNKPPPPDSIFQSHINSDRQIYALENWRLTPFVCSMFGILRSGQQPFLTAAAIVYSRVNANEIYWRKESRYFHSISRPNLVCTTQASHGPILPKLKKYPHNAHYQDCMRSIVDELHGLHPTKKII